MNKNEIKKALYKEKPIALKQIVLEEDTWIYYTELSDKTGVQFIVPVQDMGDKLFGDEEPAQLLIRWIK